MKIPRVFAGKTLQRKVLDVGMVVLLVGILLSIGLISAILGMRFAVRRTEVTVPRVEERTVDEARLLLTNADLELAVLGERYDDNEPKGRIISQYPRPGGTLKAKREVQVMVSLGKRTNPVPDLVGSTLRVSEMTAAEAEYEIGSVSQISLPGTREDVVIQQSPQAGSATARSPRINLLVSTGESQRFVMPDLTGQNLNQVQPFLRGRGFKLASIEYHFYRNATKGTVVKQFPEAGYLLTKSDAINLEVAR